MPCKSLVEGVNNSVTACPSLANEGAERGDSVTISLIRMVRFRFHKNDPFVSRAEDLYGDAIVKDALSVGIPRCSYWVIVLFRLVMDLSR